MSQVRRIRRALISVYDKTGIIEFARALHEEFGVEIISTGGTATALTEAGIPVTLVEQITGSPEMLDGRVKTLHPRIHAAILADRDNPAHMRQLAQAGIEPIDVVVVDLYPFEQTTAEPSCTFEQALEMIDIGGPCLLRAAAKNHRHVLVISDRAQREPVLRSLRAGAGTVDPDVQLRLAAEAYVRTSLYDEAITLHLQRTAAGGTGAPALRPGQERLRLPVGRLHKPTRYGENPHQQGAAYVSGAPAACRAPTVLDSEARSGGEMSFNNYVDANAALELCAELTRALAAAPRGPRPAARPTRNSTPADDQRPEAGGCSPAQHACVACFIKHTNACGAALAADPLEAYRQAYLGDPNAALGGILAVNFNVDAPFAAVVMETYQRFAKPLRDAGHAAAPGGFFLEVWLAPRFEDDAVRLIRGELEPSAAFPHPPRKDWGRRVRLLEVGDMSRAPDPDEMEFRWIAGGVLMQTPDLLGLNEEQWEVVTRRAPTQRELEDLRLAWLICKHTRSNAVTICKDGMLIGNGAGQMSRAMSCRIATWAAQENGHADRLRGAAAASDAFFPFRDGPELLIDAGVTALIQPGGSKHDTEVIALCDARGVAMIFTGTRHFRH